MNESTDPQFKTAVPYKFDVLQANIEFDIRIDTIPPYPRLIVRSHHGYICETGMMDEEKSKKVAIAMIEAARRLHNFTDEEVGAIKPKLSILERFFERCKKGEPVSIPDGSVAANNAFL